jgi:hypothetical protein
MVHPIPRSLCDHNQLVMHNDHVKPLKSFRFELFCPNDPDFATRVEKTLSLPVPSKEKLGVNIRG